MSASIDYVANRERFVKLQAEFRHHSARAVCVMRNGILQISYSGPITLKAIDVLESRVLPIRYGASAAIERMDTAMLAWAGPVNVSNENFPLGTPPSAVIVPEDQYDRTKEFCSLLARLGVLRMAFRPSQADLAREWADCYREQIPA